MNHRITVMLLLLLSGWGLHSILAAKTLAQSSQPLADQGRVVLDRIVAVVNGEVITLSELKEAMGRIRWGLAQGLDNPIPSEREVLNQLIERKLQLQLAQKRGITVRPEEVEEALAEIKRKNGISTDEALQEALEQERISLAQYKNDLREQLMILKLANREVRSGILLNEEELLEYYQSHKDRYLLPDEIRLYQILLRLSQPDPSEAEKEAVWRKAQALVAELRAGADFKSLARQYSEGPEAKDGGDLGFVKKGETLPSVEQAILGLSPGEVSDPVETAAGVHIFFIEAVKTGQYRPFEEVKQEIRESLFQERAAKLYGEWLRGLRDSAQVEIKF